MKANTIIRFRDARRLATKAGAILGVFLLVASGGPASGKDLYLRAGATGTNDGSDWNNAWTGFNAIQWGGGANQLSPGDTLWVAGGRYGQTFVPAGDGSPGSWIAIKRAQSTDGTPTAAAGWNNSYDSQVIINDSGGGNGMTVAGSGNYLYIDGRVDSGIQIVGHNTSGGYNCVQFTAGITGLTFTNVDFSGSWNGTGLPGMAADTRCINATAWGGSSYEAINNLTISHCRLHGMGNLMWLYNVNNSTIEYCQMYDNLADNGYHANVCITAESSNITFRYNDISNWQIEGILMSPSGNNPGANWYIYGNVWHDGYAAPSYPRILSTQDTTSGNGPIYFYNNTIVNCYEGVVAENGGSWAGGCVGRNNIYYNIWGGGTPGQPGTQTGPTEGLGDDDYDFSDRAIGDGFGAGPHDIGSGSDPFVSLGTDYQIVGTIGGTYPRGNGVALAPVFSMDMFGDIRGADGEWDIGAYQYAGGASGRPISASSYIGLFYDTNEIVAASAGYFTLSITSRGAYTGYLHTRGSRIPFSGRLDGQGRAASTLPRRAGGPLRLNLNLGASSPSNQVLGTVSGGTWVASLIGNPFTLNARIDAAPNAGNYTVVFPGQQTSPSLPAGNGYGTVRVSPGGLVLFAGKLADGVKVSQSAALASNGQWPFYLSLYAGQGLLTGWLDFTNEPASDLSGQLTWNRPADAAARYYPDGFSEQVQAIGSIYAPPTAWNAILDLTAATVAFSGGDIATAFTNSVSLGAFNHATNLSADPLNLTFWPASGLFTGAVQNPATGGALLPFSGAVFQKLATGYGMSLGADQSSGVVIGQ